MTSPLCKSFSRIGLLKCRIHISLVDERTGKKQDFQYATGVAEFVRYMNQSKKSLHNDVVYFKGEKDTVESRSLCSGMILIRIYFHLL